MTKGRYRLPHCHKETMKVMAALQEAKCKESAIYDVIQEADKCFENHDLMRKQQAHKPTTLYQLSRYLKGRKWFDLKSSRWYIPLIAFSKTCKSYQNHRNQQPKVRLLSCSNRVQLGYDQFESCFVICLRLLYFGNKISSFMSRVSDNLLCHSYACLNVALSLSLLYSQKVMWRRKGTLCNERSDVLCLCSINHMNKSGSMCIGWMTRTADHRSRKEHLLYCLWAKKHFLAKLSEPHGLSRLKCPSC